jgi:hypothetical protein
MLTVHMAIRIIEPEKAQQAPAQKPSFPRSQAMQCALAGLFLGLPIWVCVYALIRWIARVA